MLHKKKIRLMTKLAIYDKKYGVADKKNNDFFKWDYIYFRNFGIRIGVLFGCLILSALYVFKVLVVEQVDIMTIDIKSDAAKIGVFIVAVLGVYTIIGSIMAKKEYEESEERLAAYFAMIDKLDRFSEAKRMKVGEAEKRGNGIESEDLERLGHYGSPPYNKKKKVKTDEDIDIISDSFHETNAKIGKNAESLKNILKARDNNQEGRAFFGGQEEVGNHNNEIAYSGYKNKKTAAKANNKSRTNKETKQADINRKKKNKGYGKNVDREMPPQRFEDTFAGRQYLMNLKGETGLGSDDRHENPNNSRI